MPRIALLALFCAAAAAACTSTAPPPEEPGHEPVGVSLASFARQEGLSGRYDPARGRWLYTRGTDRVLLYPGTSIAVVNGRRIQGMGEVRQVGGSSWLDPADVERLRAGLRFQDAPLPVARTPEPVRPARSRPAAAAGLPPSVLVPLGRKWRYIVLHHSATPSGSAAEFHRHHKQDKGWDGLGYHFVIGNGQGSKDGQVEVGYRWTRQLTGAHAGRPPDNSNKMNEQGIGVCLVGNFEKSRPSAAQIRSLHALVDYLGAACSISADRVILHRDIRGTKCPGRHFPAAEFSAHRAKP